MSPTLLFHSDANWSRRNQFCSCARTQTHFLFNFKNARPTLKKIGRFSLRLILRFKKMSLNFWASKNLAQKSVTKIVVSPEAVTKCPEVSLSALESYLHSGGHCVAQRQICCSASNLSPKRVRERKRSGRGTVFVRLSRAAHFPARANRQERVHHFPAFRTHQQKQSLSFSLFLTRTQWMHCFYRN